MHTLVSLQSALVKRTPAGCQVAAWRGGGCRMGQVLQLMQGCQNPLR